jgi:hypothetical protein
MSVTDQLVRSTPSAWMVRPPLRCRADTGWGRPRMLIGSIACSCGRHLTWRCECGAVTYGPALGDRCSLLDGPANVR